MISLLKKEARTRNLPACVLTFEPHPREFLHARDAPRRLTNLTEKAALLASVGIDRLYVCAFDEHVANMPAPLFVSRVLVAQLAVRWLLVGDDFRFGERRLGDLDMLRRHAQTSGFEVEAMRTVSLNGERVSSTAVREAYAQRDGARMGALLGRPQLTPCQITPPSGDEKEHISHLRSAMARVDWKL